MSGQKISVEKPKHHKGVLLIAVLKLFKGLLLLIIGLGAISLLGKDVVEIADRWMRYLHLDPSGKFFYAVLDELSFVDDHRLRQVSAGTFFYASVMLTEGVGLLFEKRWAEWLTVLVTASFVPFEIYEIARRFSAAKVGVLATNIVIVVYLIFRLREKPVPAAKKASA